MPNALVSQFLRYPSREEVFRDYVTCGVRNILSPAAREFWIFKVLQLRAEMWRERVVLRLDSVRKISRHEKRPHQQREDAHFDHALRQTRTEVLFRFNLQKSIKWSICRVFRTEQVEYDMTQFFSGSGRTFLFYDYFSNYKLNASTQRMTQKVNLLSTRWDECGPGGSTKEG